MSAGGVSLGVHGDATGFGEKLKNDLLGQGALFGSIGKSLGGLVVAGLGVAGIGMSIGALFKTGFEEYSAIDKLNAQFEAGIKSTNNVAGLTVKGMNDLAASIVNYSGQTSDSVGKTEQLLQTFTNIRNVGANKIFDQATIAATDMAAKMGGDASSTAIQLGKALNDPIKGITALTRVGVTFSDAQKTQIAAMVKAGDTIGAQKVILAELNTEFGGAAAAAGQTLPGTLQRSRRAFEDLGRAVVTGLVPVIMPALNGIIKGMQALVPKVDEFEEKVSDAFKLIKGTFTGEGADVDLGKWTNPLIDFGAALRTVVDAVKGKASEMWGTLKPVFEQIGGMFAALAPTIGPLVPQILGLVTAFSPFHLILTAIEPVLPPLLGSLGQFAVALATLWAAVIGAQALVVVQLVTGFAALEVTVVAHLLPAAIQLAVTLGPVLQTALSGLLPVVGQLVGMLAGQLGAVLAVLIPVVVQLVAAIGPVLGDVLTALVPMLGMVAGFVLQLFQAMLPLAPIVVQLATALQPLVGLVLELVTQLLPPITSLLMALLPVILAVALAVVSLFVPVLVAVIRFLATLVRAVLPGFAKAFAPVLDAVGRVAAVLGVLGAVIGAGFDGVVEFVKGVFNTIIGLVNGIIDGINPVAAGVSSAVGIRVGPMPHLPALADSGTVLPTPGGTVVRVAEAGKAESIVDTGKLNNLIDATNEDQVMEFSEETIATLVSAMEREFKRAAERIDRFERFSYPPLRAI